MTNISGSPLRPPKLDWRSFTEFFEGEGAIRVRTRGADPYLVRLGVSISQREKPKLEQLKDFLASEDIAGALVRDRGGVSILEIRTVASLKKLLKAMKPFAYLKKLQVETALDYLEDRITGDQLFETIEEVSSR